MLQSLTTRKIPKHQCVLEHEASRSYQPSNTGIAAYYQADGLALRLPRVPSTHHLHGESPAEEVIYPFFGGFYFVYVCVHIIAARSSFSRTVFLERSEGREGQHARVKGERVGKKVVVGLVHTIISTHMQYS